MMIKHFIVASEVIVPASRQRTEFDPTKHQELKSSIEDNGLINAISLKIVDDHYELVAGERRLRAILDIIDLGGSYRYAGETVPELMIPFIPLGELSALDAEVIELEENIRREDLNWQDRAAATARVMEIRSKQATLKGAVAPTSVDIAEELHSTRTGSRAEATRQEIILAKHLDNPIVKNAKTREEAFKALKREDISNKNAALAVSIGKTLTHSDHQLYHADTFTKIKEIPTASVDVICTDPPYGMGADTFGDSGGGAAGGHFYSDSSDILEEILDVMPAEFFRITKPDAHAYIFCDVSHFYEWYDRMSEVGWKVFRTPLIWFKPAAFRAPWPEQGPQRKYECILYAVKGSLKCTRLYGDVLEYPTDTNLGHEAQKPVSLYTDLLRRSVVAGFTVFDPFAGTGPVFPAAHALSCRAVGIEVDAAAYGIAATRIQKLGGKDV